MSGVGAEGSPFPRPGSRFLHILSFCSLGLGELEEVEIVSLLRFVLAHRGSRDRSRNVGTVESGFGNSVARGWPGREV